MKSVVVLRIAGSETRYSAELEPFRTVLDLLESLRAAGNPELVYRHSCHHGSCGTCGAMVNGKPRLMCLTKVGEFEGEEIVLEPLKKATMIEGVAVWPGLLFKSLPDTSYLRTIEEKESAPQPPLRISALLGVPGIGDRPSRLEACIECGLCVAACPVEKGFMGPAALTAAEIELDKDPSRAAEMIRFAGRTDGARKCERFFGCSRACPQGLAPGRRITNLLSLLR